jgi:hypothetical protein
MTSYVETKIVALTSQSASIKSNGDFLSNVYYNLGAIYNNDNNIIHTQVQLLNAQIPYSFYVVNYTNNQFKYQFGSGTIFTSSIPTGNYTGNSLITALKTALTSNGITLAIVLSSINGKLTFTHASSNFTLFPLTFSILPILGFDSNVTYTSSSFSLTSPYTLNLLGIKTLQVRSSNLIMSNISSVQGGQTTLLATIPVDCTPFGMINFIDQGNHLMTIHNDSLDDLQIEIIDGESSNFINFNNQNWCITLAFHITRTFETIPKPTIQSIVGKPLEGATPPSQPRPQAELPTTPSLENAPLDGTEKDNNPPLNSPPESKDIQELNLLTKA